MVATPFQCPEGLGWDCHLRLGGADSSRQGRFSARGAWLGLSRLRSAGQTLSTVRRFSAPRGLVGIVTWGFTMPGECIMFQCPEGLGWDCHRTGRTGYIPRSHLGFSAPRGLVGIVTLSVIADCRPPNLVSVPRGAWLGLSRGDPPARQVTLRFQCPEGLGWDCHEPWTAHGEPHAAVAYGFSAPRGLVGIVTGAIRSQCLKAGCHSVSVPRGAWLGLSPQQRPEEPGSTEC